MRNSLLSRLVGLSLGVASLAVCATALLATYGTGRQLSAELAGDASLLEADSDILAALFTYANEHRDWADVDSVVRALADRTGRRIAVTTPDGEPIADSAQPPMAALPPVPSARIDATTKPTENITARPNIVVRDPALNVSYSFYVWQLTEEEQQQRQALVAQALDCLRTTEVKPTERAKHHHVNASGGAVTSANPCIPPALLEPSTAGRALEARVAELTAGCRDEQCVAAANADAKQSYVAAPANLYLGESTRFDPFSPDGWWRTAMTAGAVLLAAAAVTVLAGRRLVRPIRALTTVARRIAAGDRTARVPVRGNDEVTRLAAAFNTMAASVDDADQQHKALVSDVAHELRTPLANVRGHLEAALDGVLPLDPELVRSLIEESALLERLVADLQDLALADAGKLAIHPEERDAADLAEATVAAHRAQAEVSGVELRLVAAPAVVHADPGRLRQALGNLVSNAIRHTPAGGTVTVTVGETGDAVTLAVADTGSGIAEEHLPHIFDRLYRADPSRSRATGGSGLGLAITKHLVTAHGGDVEVTSTPGAGSVFTIRLPERLPANGH